MPTRKVISVLIVCLAIVASLGIWQYNSARAQASLASQNNPGLVPVNEARPLITTSTDWQSVLQNTWGTGTTTIITPTASGEGTLTDQMAKDFFGQYLQASQGGQTVTDDQATQIAENTLADTAPSQSTAATYTVANLHISENSNNDTVLNYFSALTQTEQKYSSGLQGDELNILNEAIQSNNPSELDRITPIVASYQGVIKDLLTMTVPADAINLHLALLNSVSDVLDNIESIQVSFSDPAKSFIAIGQYEKNITARDTAITNLEYYSINKKNERGN